MANEMTTGVAERLLYGAIIAGTAKLVANGYLTPDMQAYVAGGGVAAIGGVWAWWLNRPSKILDAAAAQIPENSKLVIATPAHAPLQEKDEACELANAAGAKVLAKVT